MVSSPRLEKGRGKREEGEFSTQLTFHMDAENLYLLLMVAAERVERHALNTPLLISLSFASTLQTQHFNAEEGDSKEHSGQGLLCHKNTWYASMAPLPFSLSVSSLLLSHSLSLPAPGLLITNIGGMRHSWRR